MNERLVLAFSGGLSSTAAIPWLIEQHGLDVVGVAVDLGQGRELDGIRERALGAGAIRCHVLDRRQAFLSETAWPMAASGLGPEVSPESLGAPILARALVEVARLEHAVVVAHGATGQTARQLETLVGDLEPGLEIVAALPRVTTARHDLAAYLDARGVHAPIGDQDLAVAHTAWGRSVSGAGVADPWLETPESAFALTRPPADGPEEPAVLEISFERGVPTQVNGVAMPLTELVESVTTIAGAHGIGRLERVTTSEAGAPLREAIEAPAAVALRLAHGDLETIAMSEGEASFRPQVAAAYASILAQGHWYSPFRSALDHYLAAVQARVNGAVKLRLYKGACRVIGRRLEQYDRQTAATNADRR